MSEQSSYRPANEAELCGLIRDAVGAGSRLRIRGGGSLDSVGAQTNQAGLLDMSAFSGIVDYDPPELVLTVRAATPLSEVESLLNSSNQMLAFAPYDPAPIFGGQPGRATIGGTIAAGISGSQRLTRGAARDHLLGFTAVSGRGETFVAGAKVVKNVTGYDLSKLMCGSWGRLAALTQFSLKVLPLPEVSVTLVAKGLTVETAYRAMAHCLGSTVDVAAAAHLPEGLGGGKAITALQLHGFAPSVEARCRMIEAMDGDGWLFSRTDPADAEVIWNALKWLSPLPIESLLWRVSLPAKRSPGFIRTLGADKKDWLVDWAGGLIWLAGDYAPELVRGTAERLGGHAMLMRAPGPLRDVIPVFHPPTEGVAMLEERVRRAFDPSGVFETGRF